MEAQTVSVERHRPYLPESVDKYEAKIPHGRASRGATLCFSLFDGRNMSGQVIGFGPYSITVRQADGTEVTIYKACADKLRQSSRSGGRKVSLGDYLRLQRAKRGASPHGTSKRRRD